MVRSFRCPWCTGFLVETHLRTLVCPHCQETFDPNELGRAELCRAGVRVFALVVVVALGVLLMDAC